MKKRLDLAVMFAVVTLVTLVIGCDNLLSGDPIDFEEWMRCPGPKKDTTGDLVWIDFDVIGSTNPLPGDTVSINITLQNVYDDAFPENPNIPLSGNLRVFLEDNQLWEPDPALRVGIGTIGPEDWLLAEYMVPGLFADKKHVIVENATIPYTNHFPLVIPDPGKTPDLGPEEVFFTVYGVLDAQNCIGERDETNNETISTINGSAGTLNVTNPYLPNLQIKYLQRTPTSPLPHTGGSSITEWEVLNAGIGPVKDSFLALVFLSEDDVYDTWDEMIGNERITDEIAGNTNKLIYITATLPYSTWRNNGWSLFSSLGLYDKASGDDMKTRELPPAGPPGYMFTVYPCISGFSPIIGYVDPWSLNEVREAVEADNYSFQGLGGNGDLEVYLKPNGSDEIELIELRADNYTAAGGGNTSNVYDVAIRYSAAIQYAENCSMAFYWSKDDTAQFGDYFCQRYWFQIQPGTDILLYPFGINFVWKPDPLPSPGTYRFVMVMDDIYKFEEPDEDNNTKLSIGTVQVG